MSEYTYILSQFDGLAFPDYVNVANLGTGNALTALSQLPERGYYDHYGTGTAPRGIQDIRWEGYIIESTAALRRAAVDNWRKKIGVRGRLGAAFDDGSVRWQWARLIDIDSPQEIQEQTRVPLSLTFRGTSQHWFEVVHVGSPWTWGDGSWVFGDGTAEMGEEGTSQTLTATGATFTGSTRNTDGTSQVMSAAATTHDGNIDATNLVITVTAGTNSITNFQWVNSTSGYTVHYGNTVAAGDVLVIDCGGFNVTNDGADAYASFTPSNLATWDVLVPGANTVTVYVTGNAAQDATIVTEFYDHFA